MTAKITPTKTFLSLPSEIRQKILIQSYLIPPPNIPSMPSPDPGYHWSRAWLKLNIGLASDIMVEQTRCCQEDPRIFEWACRLMLLHPILEADMSFVLKGWQDEVQGNRDKCERILMQFWEIRRVDLDIHGGGIIYWTEKGPKESSY